MKYVLLDKKGELVQMYSEQQISLVHRGFFESDKMVRSFDTYEEALDYAKSHGNLDVAEVRVITSVRTTTSQQQHIDYHLEDE